MMNPKRQITTAMLIAFLICSFPYCRNYRPPHALPFITVLGIVQDGGFPHAGCVKDCCADAWEDAGLRKHVVSLGIVDPSTSQCWIIDATPDFPDQLHTLTSLLESDGDLQFSGILLTHAHIGHYTGLMYLGREAMNSQAVPVYCMDRMRTFLSSNGPWDQLVLRKNIVLHDVHPDSAIHLNENIRILPFCVPHRDEYSETAGFQIIGPNKSCLFIPDIDKWEKWNVPIEEMVEKTDIAFLDGTFFSEQEIPGRKISEIPHPFIIESITRLGPLPLEERNKIHFIHFNHTNPVLKKNNPVRKQITSGGFRMAREGQFFEL
jgi:pyrroloquinoline quinone biosynthesis protein B